MFISPTVVGDNVIIGSCAGSLYALDRAAGTVAWRYDTRADGAAAEFHGEPLLIGDAIVVPTDTEEEGHLYSLDVRTGELRWKVPFPYGVAANPLLVGDRVVVVSVQGEVAAIEPKNGRVGWKVSPAGTLEPLPYVPSPAAARGRIFVADNAGKVFALDAANGKTIWTAPLAARANTALVLVGKSIVVGTSDRRLQWIDADSGKITRRVELAGIPYGTPIPTPSLLFVLVQGTTSTLLALDPKSGVKRWERETAKEWTTYRPLVAGSLIIVGNGDRTLCAFDRADGTERWCRAVGQIPRGLGTAGDALYVGSLSGRVLAFPFPR